MATMNLTRGGFLRKVYDYETNPSEWKFIGPRPALIDFYASWCGPCKEQLKHMQAVKDELKGKDVVYLYFANNTPEDVRQVIVKKLGLYGDNIFHYNLPDEQQESIERLLGVTKFPTFMLFDKNGKLVSSDAPFPQHIDALINEINKCLE